MWVNPLASPAANTGWESVKKTESKLLSQQTQHIGTFVCLRSACPSTTLLRCYNFSRCWNTIYLHKWQVNSGRLWRREEQHQFVSPTRAMFAQTGPNNVLTKQVADKLAGGDTVQVWEDRCSQSAMIGLSAFCICHPSLLTYTDSSLNVPVPHPHTDTERFRSLYEQLSPSNNISCLRKINKLCVQDSEHENLPCASFPWD